MWPDRVSNLGPLTYESGALPIALRGPASNEQNDENAAAHWLVQICLNLHIHCKCNPNASHDCKHR